ncbi:hypothetical protein, partial [Desulfovirgula thermocuniculi]|uniref:hypothetical protein n=1 Tax=Desulfovirgula thermocuniculi TaxID=348842 RepID=UPI0005532E3B
MLRVLLATGDVELDGAIASALTGKGAEVAGECRTREDAAGAAAERGADVVVLSPRLPGRIGMVELVRSLRAAGLRMVLLAGARADVTAQSLAREAISLGVYDVVWDPIVIDQVVQRILTPAAPAEAGVVRGEGITGSGGVAGEGGQKVPIWRRLFRRGKLTGHAKESGRPVASPSAGAPDGPPARTGGDPRGGEAAASAAAGEAPAWEASFRRLEPTGEEREGTPGDGSPRDAAEAGGKRVPPVPRAHGGRVWAGEPEPRVGSRGSPAGALVLAGRDVAALLREAGIKIVSDPLDAKVCVCDPARAMLAPRGMPLLVVRSGSVSDLAAAMSRPDASLVDRAGLAEAVRRALAEEMPGNPEGGRIGIPAPGLGEVLRDPLTGCYTRRCLEVL